MCTMMKLNSKFGEFEVECSATEGPKHSALQDILYNEVPYDDLNIEALKDDAKHCIVKVTIAGKDRKIVEIGEATPETLTTDIARRYPFTTACNRAIDRAILRYIGVNNVYAASEGVKQNISVTNDTPVSDSVSDEIVDEFVPKPMPMAAPKTEKNEESIPVSTSVKVTEAYSDECKKYLDVDIPLRRYDVDNNKKLKFAPLGWLLENAKADVITFNRLYGSKTNLPDEKKKAIEAIKAVCYKDGKLDI